VPIKISVKGKIAYNGKEYTSAADLPDDVRHAYERALGASDGADAHGLPIPQTKIVFNGQEYGRVDEMPANVRRMYDAVMLAVEGSAGAAPCAGQGPGQLTGPVRSVAVELAPAPSIVPASSSSRALLVLTAVGLLLLTLYLLSGMAPSR
jgi:hypothetical protein